MAKPIVIKTHPIAIIKDLVALEFLVAAAYFAAGLLANYGELYQRFTFSEILSYEIAKFLVIVAAEALLLVYIFLRWFFASYVLYPDKMVIERGILLKRDRTISFPKILLANVRAGPIAKLFKYGTLRIENERGEAIAVLRHLPRPEMYRRILLGERGAAPRPADERGIEELLQSREHEHLEFKTSFRWDMREEKVNRVLERTAMKTVAAFLNSDGGHLIFGVGDDGEIVGLAHDLRTLPKQGADGFENHFTNIFRETIGPEHRRFATLAFHRIGDKEICHVRVLPGTKPAYLKLEQGEVFVIRTGNSTTPLRLSEATSYIRSRFRED